MRATAPKTSPPATYRDVLDAPANRVAEVIHGVLHTQKRPSSRHGFASSNLGVELGSTFDPAARLLEAFELKDGHWSLIAALKDDDPVRIRPFYAVEFSLGLLWP